MGKLRLMTIVGTRPEIIKMSAIIKKADKYFDQILVHTGQNYDYTLNEVFFKDLGLREPDYYLGVVGDNLGQTMGNVIAKSYELMAEVKPDAIIVLGDTNSCLCVISAKRLKIPIFHMEAGNRCKDENLPEEVIRRVVDVTSDINLCYSEHARRYILDTGVKPEYTYVVGSPMAEVLKEVLPQIEASTVLEDLLKDILDRAEQAFEKRDVDAAFSIEPLQQVASEMVNKLKRHHLDRMGRGECDIYVDSNFENLMSDMQRIADVSTNIGEAIMIRVHPELADNGHVYFTRLRSGKDERFNTAYNEAYEKYSDRFRKVAQNG